MLHVLAPVVPGSRPATAEKGRWAPLTAWCPGWWGPWGRGGRAGPARRRRHEAGQSTCRGPTWHRHPELQRAAQGPLAAPHAPAVARLAARTAEGQAQRSAVGRGGSGGRPATGSCSCLSGRLLTRALATPPLTVMDRLRGCSRRGAPPEARRGARSSAAGLLPLRVSFFCSKNRRVGRVAGRCSDARSQMGLSVGFPARLRLLLPLLRNQVVQRLVESRLCRHRGTVESPEEQDGPTEVPGVSKGSC